MSTMAESPGKAAAVNALNASQAILQCFWDLASLDEVARLEAGQKLVNELLEDQAAYSSGAAGTKASANANDDDSAAASLSKPKQLEHALRRCSPAMVYSLRRLTRGLGSSRQGSRQGFATALAALLAQPNCPLQPQGMLTLLDNLLEASNSMKGGDQRDALLGRLFGLGALVRSGALSTGAAAPAVTARVVEGLLSIANKKNFMRESAVAVVIELMQRLEPAAAQQLLSSCQALRAFLSVPPQDATPEALLLAMALWPVLPQDLLAAGPLPQGSGKAPAPPPAAFFQDPAAVSWATVAPAAAALFDKAYLQKITPALLATSASNPRLHSLWNHTLPFLLPGFTPTRDKASSTAGAASGADAGAVASHIDAFWTVVVEEGLCASSNERKFLAFQLFQVMLPHLPAAQVPVIFSRNFTHHLTNSLRKTDAYLHASAKKLMERLSSFMERADASAATKLALSSALQRLGGLGFDSQAKSKSTSKLLQGMDEQGLDAFCQQMMEAFAAGSPVAGAAAAAAGGKQQQKKAQLGKRARAGEGEDADVAGGDEDGDEDEEDARDAVDRHRRYVVEQLASVTKFPAATDEKRMQVLRFLALHAFFEVQPGAAAPAAPAAKTPKKGGKQAAAAAAAQVPPEVAAAAAAGLAAGAAAPPLSAAIRQLCAQRLVVLAASAPSGNSAAAAAAGGAAKKQKGKDGAAVPAAAQQQQAAHADAGRLLQPALAFVRQLLQAPASAVKPAGALPPDAEAALSMLQEAEGALEALLPGSTGAGAVRVRGVLSLLRLLQLHVLGDPAAADATLVLDLRKVVKEGLGAALEDVEEQEMSDEEGGDAGGAEGGDKAAAAPAPHWCEVLLDVLLALMSRPAVPLPSAPLRDACEGVWRTCCDALTLGGMQDLLRVLTAGDRQTKKGEEEDDVMGDEEEDDEEEVEMEVGSDDEDEDDDDDEEEEEEEEGDADKTQEEKKAKKQGSESGSDEEEESDDDDFDDEAMMRMDEKIAAYLRSVTDQKRGARETAQALAALKFRALSLLEAFAKRSPSSPLLLVPLLPLLRTMSLAARPGSTNAALAQRLHAVLSKTLCKSKPTMDPEVLPVPEYTSALKRALYVASREHNRQVAGVAGSGLALLLRAGAQPGAAPEAAAAAAECMATALTDFLRKKRSRLQRGALEEMMARAPAAAYAPAALTALMKEAAGGARNAHLQAQSVHLLAALLKAGSNQQQQGAAGSPAAAAALKPHAASIAAAVTAAVCGSGMKKDVHAEAVKSACNAVESLKALSPGSRLGELMGPERINAVAKAVVTLRDIGELPPKVDAQLSKLAQSMGIIELLAKTQPDPALRAKLAKARALQQQQQQQQAEGGKKQKAGKKQGAGKKQQGKKQDGGAKAGKQQQQKPKQQKQKQGAKPAAAEAKPKQQQKKDPKAAPAPEGGKQGKKRPAGEQAPAAKQGSSKAAQGPAAKKAKAPKA